MQAAKTILGTPDAKSARRSPRNPGVHSLLTSATRLEVHQYLLVVGVGHLAVLDLHLLSLIHI